MVLPTLLATWRVRDERLLLLRLLVPLHLGLHLLHERHHHAQETRTVSKGKVLHLLLQLVVLLLRLNQLARRAHWD